ncbi:ABC transporter ATP-binding protein [Halorussus caseinilyticus]|uniref:ABC transporter ATP-binding protein n=1 Tax=Halorussus caseinilyticus TaxID=3034025 RepID=A0ABD5WEU6_9EURY|nr:ABC transporter ATP-binding protein [Halorussus sp. DT72]
MTGDISNTEKLAALREILTYRPLLMGSILTLGVVAALLEGIGLSFLIPIIEMIQSGGTASAEGGVVGAFARVYATLGVPFTLESVVAGVVVVMGVRYASGFGVMWLGQALRTYYEGDLKRRAFDSALGARIAYFNRSGSDEILNAIVTQSKYAGRSVSWFVKLLERALLAGMYGAIALYLAPVLTLVTGVVLAAVAVGIRYGLESGYSVGDRVTEANERIQQAAQAGTQGIREVKLFGVTDEVRRDFREAVDTFVGATVRLRRNEAAVNNVYQFASAISIFVLIYLAVTFTSMNLGMLGVFLFAMFRLAPILSMLNHRVYQLEGNLPHVVRTNEFIEDLQRNQEPANGDFEDIGEVNEVAFRDVSFSYPTGERVLDSVSFSVSKGEFVAFVGQSGAGKSTVVSLLSRMYLPDEGEIVADGCPISDIDLKEWRSKLAIVRQDPYVFDDTLWYNLTVGNRSASREEVARACDIAEVNEFLDSLPDGFDTQLGEEGVRLSGGQKQRIALARALLKEDAEILVLDEATSDLDSVTEERVQAGIESMDREYAVITIAHQLSTIRNADQINTIENGHIAEKGSHDALLDNEGTYADLYSRQYSD